jgi:hypothetical protein
MFEGLEKVDESNEDLFKLVAGRVILNFVEMCIYGDKTEEKKFDPENSTWDVALEFPQNIDSNGRSLIHDIANIYGLSHHPVGSKERKTRRVVIYPRTLYIKRQEDELNRLENEIHKIKSEYKSRKDFKREPPKNPLTLRDQVLREIWEE